MFDRHKKFLITLIVTLAMLLTDHSNAQSFQYCDLYGSVYVETNPNNAHFIVFLEESESAANLLVYQEENRLFADRKGAWFFTKNRGTADFIIYFEKERRRADFSIFYTEVLSFAGCQ